MVKRSAPQRQQGHAAGRQGQTEERSLSDQYPAYRTSLVVWACLVGITSDMWNLTPPTPCWSQLASLPVNHPICLTFWPPSSPPRLTFTSQVGKKVKLFRSSSVSPRFCSFSHLTFLGFNLHLIAILRLCAALKLNLGCVLSELSLSCTITSALYVPFFIKLHLNRNTALKHPCAGKGRRLCPEQNRLLSRGDCVLLLKSSFLHHCIFSSAALTPPP